MPASPQEAEGAIPLPDIKEALKKKEMEEELARMEEEKEASKVKIKRGDSDALLKVRKCSRFVVLQVFWPGTDLDPLAARATTLRRCRRFVLRGGGIRNCQCPPG